MQKAARPRFTGDEIRAQLQNYDRRPFIDLLTEWIQSAPDPAVVALFAIDHPDKYIAAMSALARIAGFTEKTEATVDITVNYRALSDSQLEDLMAKRAKELGMQGPIIEHSNAEREPASDAEVSET